MGVHEPGEDETAKAVEEEEHKGENEAADGRCGRLQLSHAHASIRRHSR
jgi:hypothetical protein